MVSEWKTNTKKKARYIKEHSLETGGGEKTKKVLSALEERLLSLVSKIVIDGAPNVPEPGLNYGNDDTVLEITNIVDGDFLDNDDTIILQMDDAFGTTDGGSFTNILNNNENTVAKNILEDKGKRDRGTRRRYQRRSKVSISNVETLKQMLVKQNQHILQLAESNRSLTEAVQTLTASVNVLSSAISSVCSPFLERQKND